MTETKQQLRDRIKELESELEVYKARDRRDHAYYEAYSKQRMANFYREWDD